MFAGMLLTASKCRVCGQDGVFWAYCKHCNTKYCEGGCGIIVKSYQMYCIDCMREENYGLTVYKGIPGCPFCNSPAFRATGHDEFERQCMDCYQYFRVDSRLQNIIQEAENGKEEERKRN